MKLFRGFSARGSIVQWTRRRVGPRTAQWMWWPVWTCFGWYDDETFWFGGDDGLELVEDKYRAEEGRRIFEFSGIYSWYGERVVPPRIFGQPKYEDEWDVQQEEPIYYEIDGQSRPVIWESFESSWERFMTGIGQDLYIDRKGRGDPPRRPIRRVVGYRVPEFKISILW